MNQRPPICIGITLTSILFLTDALVGQDSPRVRWNAPPSEWHWNIPEAIDGVIHGTIQSEAMNREVGYNIYLPPSYETSPKLHYPVVYYLHGASGSERSAREVGLMRQLVERGELGEVIYVFPNGGHFSRYRDWPDENVKSESLIIDELIPFIDRTYRTIDRRNGRAIAGWSMGGDGALRFATKYPEMFCAAASISAAIDWGVKSDEPDSIFAHSRRNISAIRGRTGFFLAVGTEDRLYAAHQRLVPHFEELDIEFSYQPIEQTGHNLGEMNNHCQESMLRFLSKQYVPAEERDNPL